MFVIVLNGIKLEFNNSKMKKISSILKFNSTLVNNPIKRRNHKGNLKIFENIMKMKTNQYTFV